MDLLSCFVLSTHNVSCRCCNSGSSKKSHRSFNMYKIAVVAVLLVCIDISFALEQQSDLKTHPKLLVSSAQRRDYEISSAKQNVGSAPQVESQRELTLPLDLLKDIKGGDGGDDSKLSPESKGLFFGEDTNGVPIVIGTWFRYGSYTLAFCMFGTAFLVACVASAIYYVLFVVTEPSQQVRSMENEQGWNFGKVITGIQLAYETYQTFDPYSPACQLKTVCEIQESGHFQGSFLRRLTHFIIHTDLVQKKMANVEELQAADRIGNNPSEKCTEKYPECRFSIDKLYEKYVKM